MSFNIFDVLWLEVVNVQLSCYEHMNICKQGVPHVKIIAFWGIAPCGLIKVD
jgi:hypothetical protein